METYNRISTAIFDVLLAPFGHDWVAFDLIVWPVVMGVVALWIYKYVSNQDAIARLTPGGILLSCSCSSHVDAAALRGVLAGAARAAERSIRIFETRGAGPDHPTLPAFPEGDYLHAIFAYVD